ncbi:MAG: hypothetical protein V3T33_01100 [Myxococcota bacterium]
MARVHLFEFEDLAWFPTPLRDMMTEDTERVLVRGESFRDPAGSDHFDLRVALTAIHPMATLLGGRIESKATSDRDLSRVVALSAAG